MQRRKFCDLTQEELSEKIGFSKNHISSIERGKFVPTTQFIFKLCHTLGETPDYYLIGKISKESEEITELVKQLPLETQHFLRRMLTIYLVEFQAQNKMTK